MAVSRRSLVLGGLGAVTSLALPMTLAAPASALTRSRRLTLSSSLYWTGSVTYTILYRSGAPAGMRVTSGSIGYTGGFTGYTGAPCNQNRGIYNWAFVLLDYTNGGYDYPAWSGSTWTTRNVRSRSWSGSQDVYSRTYNGSAKDWRSLGIAAYAESVTQSSSYCGYPTISRFLYQPYYDRWMTRSNAGGWSVY